MAVGALADTGAYFGADPSVLNVLAGVGLDLNDIFIIARAIRPLRLVYTIPPLVPVYRVSVKTLGGLVYILCLLGLFMFIFSVLGMQLFGGKFGVLGQNPRAHYDTFPAALTTTFQIMTFDSWQHVMYDGIRANGGLSALYFVAWVVIGSMVMLNLLLVIIIEVYVQVKDSFSDDAFGDMLLMLTDVVDDVADELTNALSITAGTSPRAGDSFENDQGSPSPYLEDERDAFSEAGTDPVTEASCGMFPPSSEFRRVCTMITHSKHLDHFVLGLIVANCVTMTMDHPDIDPASDMRLYLDVIDVVFTIIFTVEMILHIVSMGFSQPEHAYLRGWWNRIDFAIVVISWVDYLAAALEIGFLRTLRLLRALRALRMFNRMRGLKVLIDSLLDSIVALSTIFAVTMLFFLIYSVLGVTAFKGRFHRCTSATGVAGVDDCIGTFVSDEGGIIQERRWIRPISNFDNVGNAMFTLFTVSTSNDWIITAQLAMDAPPYVGQQPIREYAPWRIVYFMVFIVLVNFFFLNLFTGVIYGKYVDRAMAGTNTLTKDQLQWLDVLRQLSHAKPRKDVALIVKERQEQRFGLTNALGLGMLDDTLGGHVKVMDDAMGAAGAIIDGTATAVLDLVPDLELEVKAYQLVEHKLFDRFIVLCIFTNCVMMACTHHDEPAVLTTMLTSFNVVFTVIFTAEMALKQFAFGFAVYFGDAWLRFDCFVVVGSLLDLLFTWLGVDLFSSSLFRIIRISRVIGRIGRAFKLLGDSKSTLGLDEVMECLYQALPQLAYIGILVGLIIFIFAVLAMNLFGKLAHTGCIGPHTNFERGGLSILTLLGVATKDRITCTIHATLVEEPYCSEADGTCGTPGLPQVFFVAFSMIIMFTTLEMFVNVVLQSFEHLSDAAGLPITLAHIAAFEAKWQKYDPRATGWIALKDIEALFADLPPQVGMDELAGEPQFDARYLRLIELPDGNFSRYLLGETPQEVRDSRGEAGIIARTEFISTLLFQRETIVKQDGLHAGEIDGVTIGDDIDGKPSFLVQTNLKKTPSNPAGKVYVFLADTPEERDEWVCTIKGTRGGHLQQLGTLYKQGGWKRDRWDARYMIARVGSLEWTKGGDGGENEVYSDEDLGKRDSQTEESVPRISVIKLTARLATVSGLTKKEVQFILGSPYFNEGTTAKELAVSKIEWVTKKEWDAGVSNFNEAQSASRSVSADGGQVTRTASTDESMDEGDRLGTQSLAKLITGQVSFYELLYAVCDRKAGKKLPNNNHACREVRIRMGVSFALLSTFLSDLGSRLSARALKSVTAVRGPACLLRLIQLTCALRRQVRMPSIKERVLADIRRHSLNMTPAMLASMDAAGVTDELGADMDM